MHLVHKDYPGWLPEPILSMDISHISCILSSTPRAFPNYCLAISDTLIANLAASLPKRPKFTISIGSGSGLLEALITHLHSDVTVEGVEVNSSVNRYILEKDINVVSGTWDVHQRAALASAWMFVYPREPKLVKKYIDTYGTGGIETIIWLGPKADWPDYEPCFRDSSFSSLKFPEDGLTPYEMLAIATRTL